VAHARRAGTALYHYALASARQDDATAARFQTEVRDLVPEVIAAAEVSNPQANLLDARHELAGLRTEQEEVHRRLQEMEQRLQAIDSSTEDQQ
jgi:predicted  nucleic acid-binding Zn-ribbon protein